MKSLLKLLTWLILVRGLIAPLAAQGNVGGPLPPALTLTLTAPTEGTKFDLGVPIPIRATAVDPQGAVYRLEFYAGSTRIGVSEILTLVAIPPGEPVQHEFIWREPPTGRHELRVKAVAGEFPVLSGPVSIEVGPSPTKAQVVLLQPTDGAQFRNPEVIELVAEATDPEGLLDIVEFRANGELLGTSRLDFCPPCPAEPCPLRPCFLPPVGSTLQHTFLWERPAEGKYSIEASALRPEGEPVVSPAARIAVLRSLQAELTWESPPAGSTWSTPGEIPLEVTAVDPDGEIRRVEFFAGEKLIGVSEILTREVEIPGRPRTHRLLWANASAGTYLLQARAVSDAGQNVGSERRSVVVVGNSGTPVVWVEAVDPIAVEGGASDDGQKDTLRFRIHRLGDTPRDLVVFFHSEGLAQPNDDFLVPTGRSARVPANQQFVDVTLEPIDDRLSEGDESVILALDPSPTMGPMELYRIDPARARAKGILVDNEPWFSFELPESGDWFPLGAPIALRVLTTWSVGFVSHLEFLADGKKIGDSVVNFIQEPPPGTPVRHEFLWPNAPEGSHRLTVQTRLADGTVVVSAEGRDIRVGQVVDVPVVSLTVVDGEFNEGGADGLDFADVIVRRTGDNDQPLTVFLHWKGTATPGSDYGPAVNEVQIPAGQAEVHLLLWGMPDKQVEGDETVELFVIRPPTRPGVLLYRMNADTSQVKLLLHDGPSADGIPVVTVQVGRPYALEGDRVNRGEFFLQRSGDLSQDISVNFSLSGAAIRGSDYRLLLNPCDDCAAPDQEILGDSVVIPAGQSTITLGVLAAFDGLPPKAEAFLEDVHLQIFTPPIPAVLGAKPPYFAGIPDQATVQVVERRNPAGAEVILIAPAAGAVLPLGQPSLLRAIAVDPVGSIRRVEFVANDRLIGVSEITTEEVDIPGRLRVHTFLWNLTDAAQAGPYTLTALAKNAAGDEVQAGFVPVTVGGIDPVLPMVTIVPWKQVAWERGDWKSHVGGFVLTRQGELNLAEPLTVFVEVSGTATPGLDYQWSPPDDAGPDGSLPVAGPFLAVTFPTGAADVRLNFTADSDEVVEGDETVRLEVIEPPIRSLGFPQLLPWPASYLIGEPRVGEVVIQDANLDQPRISLTHPSNGAGYRVGEIIPLQATAIHPEAGVETIEFLVDGHVLATINYCCDVCDCTPAPKARPFTARFDWKDAAPGPHVLLARTFFGPNQVVESAPVTIFVNDGKPGSLVIVTPPEGAVYPWGHLVTIDTVGQDPNSLVSTVEFFANGEKIGETCFLCVARGIFPPGLPLHNQIQWTPAKPGQYVLTALGHFGDDRKITSPPVTVQIEEPSNGPRLTIRQPLNGAQVPADGAIPVIAIGVGREGGLTDVVLLVDGKPVAQSHLEFFRPPGVNEEVRHEFTIQLEPGTHQLAVQDLVDPAVVSPVVTVVAGRAEASIAWVAPQEGAEFGIGKTIVLEVQATDPAGLFVKVDFFAGDVLIGTSEYSCPTCLPAIGAVIPHRLEWRGAPLGKHSLTARAQRPDGVIVSSLPRHLSVTSDPEPGSFVTRVLPAGYEIEQAFTVQLKAIPDSTVAAFVVEEMPPYTLPAPGLPDQLAPFWQVRSISHDGVFDPLTGKIKFGPFFDHTPRTLTYELVANLVTDVAHFDGVVVADGRSSPIAGDRDLFSSSRHPADREPADNSLNAAELTSYAAAWKREQTWPGGPNPIPVAYVTRAAFLWKGGERYVYDSSVGTPPFCWLNEVRGTPTEAQTEASVPLAGRAVRQEDAQADGTVRVTLSVIPAPGAKVFALEEQLPANGKISEVTGGGEFTASSRILRWGPFFAGDSPVLSYVQSGVIAGGRPKGIVSFDGQNLPIHSQEAVPDTSADRLVGVDSLHDGSQQVSLEAAALQTGAEYELQVGTDLTHWTPVGTFSSAHDIGFARDAGAITSNVRFYRAVRVR